MDDIILSKADGTSLSVTDEFTKTVNEISGSQMDKQAVASAVVNLLVGTAGLEPAVEVGIAIRAIQAHRRREDYCKIQQDLMVGLFPTLEEFHRAMTWVKQSAPQASGLQPSSQAPGTEDVGPKPDVPPASGKSGDAEFTRVK